MSQSSTLYVGMDVHKESIAIAYVAAPQPRLEAAAKRRLEGVGCRRLLCGTSSPTACVESLWPWPLEP